jgi:hypothetical protein
LPTRSARDFGTASAIIETFSRRRKFDFGTEDIKENSGTWKQHSTGGGLEKALQDQLPQGGRLKALTLHASKIVAGSKRRELSKVGTKKR